MGQKVLREADYTDVNLSRVMKMQAQDNQLSNNRTTKTEEEVNKAAKSLKEQVLKLQPT